MAKSRKHIQDKRESRWAAESARFDNTLPRDADEIIGIYKGVQYAANSQHGMVYFRRPDTCWSYTIMSLGKARRLVAKD